MKPRTREKIEELLNAGWTFDAELWKDSQARHAHTDSASAATDPTRPPERLFPLLAAA